MRTIDRTRRDLHPWTVVGRLMTCTSCGALVDVVEIPQPFLDPGGYVCGRCLQPVTSAQAATPPTTTAGRDLDAYDPKTSAWPEGF